MVNPSYNGSFKFPSSTRSTGARKGGLFSRGNRQEARIFNYFKTNRPISAYYSTYHMMGGESDSCGEAMNMCWDTFFNTCLPCA